MEFQHFLSIIPEIKNVLKDSTYNAKKFHLVMTPKERLHFNETTIINSKEAAVLVLCYPKGKDTHFLLTLRAKYKGTHSGQISFPGGKKNISDSTLLHTALRESEEEVNLCIDDVKNRIALSKIYIPPSNFWVSPFLGVSDKEPIFIPNYEVEKLIEISMSDLLNDANVTETKIATSTKDTLKVPCFIFNEYIIWGATAIILSELKGILKRIEHFGKKH